LTNSVKDALGFCWLHSAMGNQNNGGDSRHIREAGDMQPQERH